MAKLIATIFMILCVSSIFELAAAQSKVAIGGKNYVIFSELVDRAAAVSLCQSNDATLVSFENADEQVEIADFLFAFDYPYFRAYWTEGLRSPVNGNDFTWESTGEAFDASLLWGENEPGPDLSKDRVYFLAETKGLITGQEIYNHSVICRVN